MMVSVLRHDSDTRCAPLNLSTRNMLSLRTTIIYTSVSQEVAIQYTASIRWHVATYVIYPSCIACRLTMKAGEGPLQVPFAQQGVAVAGYGLHLGL